MRGTIAFLNEKAWKPGTTFRNIKLEGDKVYYRLGTAEFPAGVVKAADVEFEISKMNDDGKSADIDLKTLKVLAKVVASPEAAPVSVRVTKDPVDWAAKDASIQYQSARNAAIDWTKFLVEREIVKVPAKAADKLAAIEAILDGYTAQFYMDVGTKGAVARAMDGETPAEAPQPDPAAAAESDDE